MGNNSVENVGGLWDLFSAYCLMLLYICIKFYENISKSFRANAGLLFLYSGFSKEHNSVKTVGSVMVLVLCIMSDLALYLYKGS